MNRILVFLLAYAAELFDISIHAFCFMSNHFHIVLTDHDGCLPAFMHWLDLFIAKCVSAHLGHWEHFWSTGSYSAVELVGPRDVMLAIVYVLSNPVSAGLVRSCEQWPGACSRPSEITKGFFAQKPRVFFREKGCVPATAALQITPPRGFEHLSITEFRDLVRGLVEQREGDIRREFAARGRRFMGKTAVRKTSPFDGPVSRAPRRGLNPRVAAKDRWRRLEAQQRDKTFQVEHEEARCQFNANNPDVVFPAGTYWMRVQYGVKCRPPP